MVRAVKAPVMGGTAGSQRRGAQTAGRGDNYVSRGSHAAVGAVAGGGRETELYQNHHQPAYGSGGRLRPQSGGGYTGGAYPAGRAGGGGGQYQRTQAATGGDFHYAGAAETAGTGPFIGGIRPRANVAADRYNLYGVGRRGAWTQHPGHSYVGTAPNGYRRRGAPGALNGHFSTTGIVSRYSTTGESGAHAAAYYHSPGYQPYAAYSGKGGFPAKGIAASLRWGRPRGAETPYSLSSRRYTPARRPRRAAVPTTGPRYSSQRTVGNVATGGRPSQKNRAQDRRGAAGGAGRGRANTGAAGTSGGPQGRRRRGGRLQAGTHGTTEADLDSQLDAYMGTDAARSRLDNQLDAYFGRSPVAASASSVGLNATVPGAGGHDCVGGPSATSATEDANKFVNSSHDPLGDPSDISMDMNDEVAPSSDGPTTSRVALV